jgi:hypothetical protein
MSMNIADFILIEVGHLRDFREWWDYKRKVDPKNFPWELEAKAEWLEQYNTWLSLSPEDRLVPGIYVICPSCHGHGCECCGGTGRED